MTEYFAHVRDEDKERQTLMDHLVSVSDMSKEFAEKIGLGDVGGLIGLLHDGFSRRK